MENCTMVAATPAIKATHNMDQKDLFIILPSKQLIFKNLFELEKCHVNRKLAMAFFNRFYKAMQMFFASVKNSKAMLSALTSDAALFIAAKRRTQIADKPAIDPRSEEHTSELQSRFDLVCR